MWTRTNDECGQEQSDECGQEQSIECGQEQSIDCDLKQPQTFSNILNYSQTCSTFSALMDQTNNRVEVRTIFVTNTFVVLI